MNKNPSLYKNYINDLKAYSKIENEARFVASQLLQMHGEVSSRKSATVLELGVDRGQSTKVFLNAIHNKPLSHLISVDIRDCSNVSDSNLWTFLKMDSTNIAAIINAALILILIWMNINTLIRYPVSNMFYLSPFERNIEPLFLLESVF